MHLRSLLPWLAVPVAFALGRSSPAPPQGPAPSPEHALLKRLEGKWEGALKLSPVPGMDSEAKALATDSMLGPFWLLTDVKFEVMGTPVTTHTITGFDPTKKKYVQIGCSSMTPVFSSADGTYDEAKKTLSLSGEKPNPMTGQLSKARTVWETKDDDTRSLTGYATGPDGKERVTISGEFKRKK